MLDQHAEQMKAIETRLDNWINDPETPDQESELRKLADKMLADKMNDHLNDEIVEALGDFADWDNWAGYYDLPAEEFPQFRLMPRRKQATLKSIWWLRENVNSTLADLDNA